MKYLLDTDAITFLHDNQRSEHLQIISKLERLHPYDTICISIISLLELEYSFYNTDDLVLQNRIREIIDAIKYSHLHKIIPIDLGIAGLYGSIKSRFKRRAGISRSNIKKHNIDIIIAATALHSNSILVGGDKIYSRIQQYQSNLNIETWWSPPSH